MGDEFDIRRCGALGLFNSLYIGCFLHFLYKTYPLAIFAVSRRFPASWSGLAPSLQRTDTGLHAFSCSIVDTIHCGSLYIPMYFLAIGLLQGDRLKETVDNLRREWFITWATCTSIWMPAMSFNFYVVPPARRVQFMAVGNLVWNVLIDHIAHRGCESSDGHDVAMAQDRENCSASLSPSVDEAPAAVAKV